MEDLKPNKTNQQRCYGIARETFSKVEGQEALKSDGLTLIDGEPCTEAQARRKVSQYKDNVSNVYVVNLRSI